ncbi:MAG: hypothetical protein F4153_03195 [Acidimicrobiia bacterium]|nr:hypothetical protein [Acidimicrobiia bacterium]
MRFSRKQVRLASFGARDANIVIAEAKTALWAAERGIQVRRSQDHWSIPGYHGGWNHYWRIIIGEGDEQAANRILGVSLNGFLFDEITLASRELLDLALGRTITYGHNWRLGGTCNPQGPDHPVKTEWIDKIASGELTRAESHSFRLIDNPVFWSPDAQEAILVRARAMSPVRIQRDLLGLWVAGSGLMHPHVRYEAPPDWLEPVERVVAIDVGLRTVTHALLCERYVYPDGAERWYISDEWVWDCDTEAQITAWEQAGKIYEWATLEGTVDSFVVPADGWELRDALEAHAIDYRMLNSGHVADLILPDQDEIKGVEELNRYYRSEHLRVAPKCQRLRRENGRYKVVASAAITGIERGDKKSADGAHGCDAARYFVMAHHAHLWGKILA